MLLRHKTKAPTKNNTTINGVSENELKQVLISLIKSCLKWNEPDFSHAYNDIILSYPKIKNDSLIVRARLRSLLLDQKYDAGIKYFENIIKQKCPHLNTDKYVALTIGMMYYYLDKFDHSIYYINLSKTSKVAKINSPSEFFTEKDYDEYSLGSLIEIDSEDEQRLKIMEIECYGYGDNLAQANKLLAEFEKEYKYPSYNYFTTKGLLLVRQSKRIEGPAALKEAIIIAAELRGEGLALKKSKHIDQVVSSLCDIEEKYYNLFKKIKNLDKKDMACNEFINKLNGLSNQGLLIIDKIINGFSDNEMHNQMYQNQLNELSDKFTEMAKELPDLKIKSDNDDLIDLSSLKTNENISEIIKNLKFENLKVYKYTKALYWTLLSYFLSYKNAGLNIGGDKEEIENKDEIFQAGMQKAAELLCYIVVNLPILGKTISGIDKIIDTLNPDLNYKSFEERVFSFEDILSMCFKNEEDFDNDLSYNLGVLALKCANSKPKEIEKASPEWKLANSFIEDMRNENFNMYDQPYTVLALKDAVQLLDYLYKNVEEIISEKGDIFEKMKSVILDNNITGTLSMKKKYSEINDRAKCTCCIII